MRKAKHEDIKPLFFEGLTWKEIGSKLGFSPETIRRVAYKAPWWAKRPVGTNTNTSRRTGGTIINSVYKRINTDKDLLSESELLTAHGFDPRAFTLASATSNEWTTPIAGDDYFNYQSKISVRKRDIIDLTAEQVSELLGNLKPKRFKTTVPLESDSYMYIPLSDIHFGINTYDDYKKLLNDILVRAYKIQPKEILVSIHGDYFHVDNLLNTTQAGTRVDEVDFESSIKDGYLFLTGLLDGLLRITPNIKLSYIPGNHAPSVDYMMVNSIGKLYPQVTVDDAIEEYKVDLLGRNLIVAHHGDKVRNSQRLVAVVVSEYASDWGYATNRYIFTGHMHHEKSLSDSGMTHYQLQSPSRHTKYEVSRGFTSSEKGLQVFEFNEFERTAIYYLKGEK